MADQNNITVQMKSHKPVVAYTGRGHTILLEREKIKQRTMTLQMAPSLRYRHLQHRLSTPVTSILDGTVRQNRLEAGRAVS